MNTPNINLGAKPRIVFISTMHGSGWGGSEELWWRTAMRLLREKRAEVLANVNWFPSSVRQLEELKQAGGDVERNKPLRIRQQILHKTVGKVLGRRTAPYLERARPDLVVISQGAQFDGAAWMLECANRKLLYAAISQCFVEGHPYSDTHVDPLRRGYEEAAASYFVSEANCRDTRRQIASPIPRGKVIHNPCNVPMNAAPPYPEPKDGVFKLASVARLETVVKGHDVLFEALNAPKWKERKLHVSLYGAGTNEGTLKRLKEMYDLKNVTFAGTTSDVEGIWREHHGIVLTSRWEGLPLAVVEAMLCGRIAIVTDVGGNAEYLVPDDTGFIAAAPKAEQIDAALERAWQCRHEWKERGQRAAAQVRQRIPEDPVGVFMEEILSLLG